MKATDGDKDRQENIVYFLTGQGIDPDRPDQSKFDINKTSGELYVLKVWIIYYMFDRCEAKMKPGSVRILACLEFTNYMLNKYSLKFLT